MNPDPIQDRSALRWVRGELNESLRTARRALEAFAEGDGEAARLETCRDQLHQVQGTLQMVEVYGAAMLADEMEQVAGALAAGEVTASEQAAEHLMLGLVQLPGYLERIENGEPDIPLALLPLMNDLRAVRAARLVSEIALFAPRLGQLIAAEPVTPGSGNPELAREIRRRRSHYQRALLNWLRHPDDSSGLRELRDVLDALNTRAGTARLRRLLDTAGALLTVLIESPEAQDKAIRPLFGQLDRFLKQVMDVGEEAAVGDFPLDLLRSLLYYVARSDSANPVVQAVRDTAELANSFALLESGGADANLGGPDRELFEAVSDALRQDLVGIKDELDLYIRGNREDRERLTALAEPLQRVGDTLGMIGRGGLRERLKARSDQIRTAAAAEALPDDDLLMEVAGDILHVESVLAGLADTVSGEGEGTEDGELSAGELHGHVTVAVNEAVSDLAKVKDGLGAFLQDPAQPAYLAPVSERLRVVAGALRILEEPHAAEVLDALAPYLNAVATGERPLPDAAQRDALADVITAVEYFLEAVVEERSNRDEIIDYARAAGERLGLALAAPAESSAPVLEMVPAAAAGQDEQAASAAEAGSEVEALAAEDIAAPAAAGTGPEAEPAPDAGAPTAELPSEPPETEEHAEAAAAPAAPPVLEDIDEEILEVFLEEAREELEVIQEQYPRWRSDPGEQEALQTFRRSFHTLKGSGRLVGATVIGEFAWSIENLLNRVLDGSVEVGAELIGLLDDACALLPHLVEGQAGGEAPDLDEVTAVSERAFAMAAPAAPGGAAAPQATSGAEAAAAPAETTEEELTPTAEQPSAPPAIAAESPPEQSAVATAEGTAAAPEQEAVELTPPPLVLEPTLHDIFRNEANTHLEQLQTFIEGCEAAAEQCVYPAELHRALHTLHGSADTAGVGPIADLAAAYEAFVNASHQLGRTADPEAVDLLRRGLQQLRDILGGINQPGASLPSWQPLQEEVRGLARALQSELEAAEEAESDLALSEPAAPEAELDPELLEIFLDEARELVERMDSEFQAWEQEPEDRRHVADLQRTLHTLKGGARLAGVLPLGDLSHALESLFEDLNEGATATSRALQAVARRGVDQLASGLELLQSDGTVPDTAAMVRRIEAALRGEVEAADSVMLDSLDLASETLPLPDVPSETLSQLAPALESEDAAAAPAPDEELAQADSQLVSDSQLLTDSQLMTDSQLLGESQLVESQLVEAEGAAAAGDAGAASADDGQVIPFPARERPAAAGAEVPLRRPPPPEEDEEEARPSQERVRVRADLLNQMVNSAGEVSIYRARLEQQNSALGFNLEELESTISRLREQLRQLELETEAQILSRHEGEQHADFDPLELDRYSNIQQLSRALSETVNDLASIGSTLDDLSRDTETLLLQHARVSNELQDGLLRTRMVPFSSRVSRLQRVVRQTAQSLGKQAELTAQGAQGEMDRSILERIMAPLEHLLRNAVAHGIEDPAARRAAGKPEVGHIQLELGRDGSDVVVTVTDDGAGLNRDAIRRKAIARGLLDADAEVEDDVLDQYILEPGFSTADQVTQIAGRGVGMDVVQSEIKQLGGTLQLESEPGRGVRFVIRLPFTLAITDGLLVQQGEDVYAVPHGSVDGVLRVSRQDLEECYAGRRDAIHYAGKTYQVRYLGSMLTGSAPAMDESQKWYPLLLVRSGDHRVAVQVDALLGNRQIVVKSVGVQLATVRWFSGATILADGRVAMILDMSSLVRAAMAQQAAPVLESTPAAAPRGVTVMVVDDSITVRKVTTRLLERHNMQVITAKDGVDAVAALQEHHPDVMLLDIEMPRMDGFELARHMQNTEELQDIPIIMITSRTGDKHRDRALSLGVKRYLGKPYQEADLLDNIYTVLAEHAS